MSDALFDIRGKTAVITGGYGLLCSEIAKALADRGVKIAIIGRDEEKGKRLVDFINANGGAAISVKADVTDKSSLIKAKDIVTKEYKRVDILINGAGGNNKEASADSTNRFFDISEAVFRAVLDLNLIGTILSTQVFGEAIAKQGEGVVINISSVAAIRPLTKGFAYAAAKAAIDNFTKWMAVHFNHYYSKRIRVNAIAPGFFPDESRKASLIDEKTGALTDIAQRITQKTPLERFGKPDEIISTIIWLISDRSSFVNGAVIPVDGGFNAYAGV